MSDQPRMTDDSQFRVRVRLLIPRRIVAWLLHYANSDPCTVTRAQFYALKARLLWKYARFECHEIQMIEKECWGHWQQGCDGESCTRCGGTGVWDRKFIRLQRWQWFGYTFHCPEGRVYSIRESGRSRMPCSYDANIIGRIEHVRYGHASREAELWLYLVTCQWSFLWHALTGVSYCSPSLWPMCRLQWAVMNTRTRFRISRCGKCNRRFWSGGSGWMWCRKCRQPERQLRVVSAHDEDVPF